MNTGPGAAQEVESSIFLSFPHNRKHRTPSPGPVGTRELPPASYRAAGCPGIKESECLGWSDLHTNLTYRRVSLAWLSPLLGLSKKDHAHGQARGLDGEGFPGTMGLTANQPPNLQAGPAESRAPWVVPEGVRAEGPASLLSSAASRQLSAPPTSTPAEALWVATRLQ